MPTRLGVATLVACVACSDGLAAEPPVAAVKLGAGLAGARLEEPVWALQAPGDADAWYVELSAIVRRYLEDRYGLRAPELTTEEFLREARRSADLSPAHRELLTSFLEGCDRVKFAAYHPQQTESQEALGVSRRFIEETRTVEEQAA